MNIDLVCEDFPLAEQKVADLLNAACAHVHEDDGMVHIQCVSKKEIQEMNKKYREKDAPTNVLTFSYDEMDHDVALCMDVANKEADERGVSINNYVALLLVHAFLHVLGMDHEKSVEEEDATIALEQKILSECGFNPASLFSYEALA